jgi:hypothetical protein
MWEIGTPNGFLDPIKGKFFGAKLAWTVLFAGVP